MQLCQNLGISGGFEHPKPPLGTPLHNDGAVHRISITTVGIVCHSELWATALLLAYRMFLKYMCALHTKRAEQEDFIFVMRGV